MKLTVIESIKDDKKTFVLEIPTYEYIKAHFDKFDLLLLDDCNSEDATIADKLLALETITRRIEQALKPNTGKTI